MNIEVEIIYALPTEQNVLTLTVQNNCTVLAAIEMSGILTLYPQINLAEQSVGIFGQIVTLDTQLEAHDRIEIYRPLIMDPMEARRVRAKKQKMRGRVLRKDS